MAYTVYRIAGKDYFTIFNKPDDYVAVEEKAETMGEGYTEQKVARLLDGYSCNKHGHWWKVKKTGYVTKITSEWVYIVEEE